MTTLLLLGITAPTAILGAMCVWLAVRLQRAEREVEMWRAVQWDAAERIEEKIDQKLLGYRSTAWN